MRSVCHICAHFIVSRSTFERLWCRRRKSPLSISPSHNPNMAFRNSGSRKGVYIPMQPEDEDGGGEPASHPRHKCYRSRVTVFLSWVGWVLVAVLIFLFALATGTKRMTFSSPFDGPRPHRDSVAGHPASDGHQKGRACVDPSTRREWRSLDNEEKLHYIESVQCLRQTPSRLGANLSLYDDFPRVHNMHQAYGKDCFFFLVVAPSDVCLCDKCLNSLLRVGLLFWAAHDAAPFLPWHRLFINAYEKALRENCGYRGTLPCVSPLQLRP